MNEERALKGEAWLVSSEKRKEDLLIALAISPLAAVTYAAGALAVSALDRVNPHFGQTRLGQNDQPFSLLKIKTFPDGHNISKVGRVLRRWWIDETPQIWNVIKGDMSVVGNRPLMPEDYKTMEEVLDSGTYKEWRKVRHIARPGLVSLYGIDAYNRQRLSQEHECASRAELEIRYVQEAQASLDHSIIRTAITRAVT